jgi:predicted N-acetyltransferase YhbS
MRIEHIQEWALTAQDDAEIADLLARSFDTDFGGRSYFHQRHQLRLVTRDDGRIVGHMALMLRSVRLGAERFEVACLGDVATVPAYRGRGIAGALLQEAIAAAEASPGRHFLLFGVAPLYAGVGFRKAANPVTYLHLADDQSGGLRHELAENLMVLPLRAEPWDDGAELDLLGPLF